MLQIKQHITVIIPAVNEEAAIGIVISELQELLDENQQVLINEIIVADNGSTDNTANIAQSLGARIVYEPTTGYGSACLKAISALSPTDIVVFIDGDNAFFPKQLLSILQPFTNKEVDLVIGSRTLGQIEKSALTFVQQWGNQLAVFLIHSLWGHQYTDLGPFRAIRRECLNHLNMQEFTYGWTVEMQIKILQAGYKVCEVPVNTRVRLGQSKISGSFKGAMGAGIGILTTIAKLWSKQQSATSTLNEDKTFD